MTAPPLQALLYIFGAILFALSTHLVIWSTLILRLDLSFRSGRRAGKGIVCAALLFPIGMLQLLLMRHVPRVVAKPLMTTIFMWLGMVVLLVLFSVLFELARLAFRPGKLMLARMAWSTLALTVVLTVVGVVTANTPPIVITTRFPVGKSAGDYRIVQLSDLHIGPSLGREFSERVTMLANSQHADLIVISGDMVDGSVKELSFEVAPLQDLRATDGVVFVPGNHEYLSGIEPWLKHVESFGWRVLRNSRISLPRVDVIGLDDAWESPKAPESLLVPNLTRPTVMVAHQPAAFVDACRAGVDVALAGHTHGGQILPLAFWDKLQQGYVAGPYRCGRTHLYVSSGTGYWGPPMRLGTRNEISVIELAGKATSD